MRAEAKNEPLVVLPPIIQIGKSEEFEIHEHVGLDDATQTIPSSAAIWLRETVFRLGRVFHRCGKSL